MATLVFDLLRIPTAANTLDRVRGVTVMIVFGYGRIIQGASRDVTGTDSVTVVVTGLLISESVTACRFERLAKRSDYTISYRYTHETHFASIGHEGNDAPNGRVLNYGAGRTRERMNSYEGFQGYIPRHFR